MERSMPRLRHLLVTGLALALALTFGVGSASADLTLNTPNTGLSSITGPYGTVHVDLDATKTVATITFTRLSSFTFGDGGTAAVNVNGSFSLDTSFGTNGFTWTGGSTVNPVTSLSVSGNQPAGGTFGDFNFVVDNNDGQTASVTSLTFKLDKTSGTWANADSVLIANAKGFEAMAHIFTGTATTGFAGDGSGPPVPTVPEPSTLLIAAIGAFGFVGFGLNRRRRTPAAS
jgi:hypothetical protein